MNGGDTPLTIPDVFQINDLSETRHPSLKLAFFIGLRCSQAEARPRLDDAEDMVRQFVSRYCLAVHKVLAPVDTDQRKRQSSLVQLPSNLRFEIDIHHPLFKKPQVIKVSAATNGTWVEVLYDGSSDEQRRTGCAKIGVCVRRGWRLEVSRAGLG
jgi:hypothetical protein